MSVGTRPITRAGRAAALTFALALAVVVGLSRPAVASSSMGSMGHDAMDHDSTPGPQGGSNGSSGHAPLGGADWVSMPAEHLQSMIDAAVPGSTVAIPRAVYEGLVVVDKPLTLQGEGGRPILDGLRQGSVLTIKAPDVTIRHVSIHYSGEGPIGAPSGIMIAGADRTHLDDVVIQHCYLGITVRASDDVTIERSRITGPTDAMVADELHAVTSDETHDVTGADGSAHSEAQLRGDGIWLWNGRDAIVRDNVISSVRDGVYLTYGEGPVLEGNLIEESRYAVHDMYAVDATIRRNTLEGNLSGVVLMYGGPVALQQNTIVESGSPSTGFGVLVKDAGDVGLAGNVIADNRIGLHIDDAGRTGGAPTRLAGNTIAMNQIGVMLYPSTDAIFTANSFVENSTQVTLGGQGSTQAIWSVGAVGNYWSDYGGFDAGGDGTGDLAYTESGRMSQILAEEPLLLALASGPAFRLLSAVEDKWSPAVPVVMDDRPLAESRSPALRGDHAGSSVPLWVPGSLVTAACAWLLVRARRPRRVVAGHA